MCVFMWILSVCVIFGEFASTLKMSAADVESKLEECLGGGVPEDISNDNIVENDVNEIKPKVKAKTIEKKTGDYLFQKRFVYVMSV